MKNRNHRLLCVLAVIVLSVALFAVAAASGYEFKDEVTSETVGDEIVVTQSEEIPEWATRPAQERPELTEEDIYYMNLQIDEPM